MDDQNVNQNSQMQELLISKLIADDPRMVEAVRGLAQLLNLINQSAEALQVSSQQSASLISQELAGAFDELAGKIDQASVQDLLPYFQQMTSEIRRIASINPKVNFPKENLSLDLQPVVKALDKLESTVKASKPEEKDDSKIISKLEAVTKAIQALRFPTSNYVLPFLKDGKGTQVILDSSGRLPVAASFTPSGTQDMNVTQVGGNAVTTTVPVSGTVTANTTVDTTASNTITTQNLNPNSGVPTAGSTVTITLGAGQNTLAIQTVGTYTGALTLQGTVDGTNWVSFAGTPLLNVNTGLWLATITSALQTVLLAKVSGFAQVRISALAAVTGSVVVTLETTVADSFQGAVGVVTTLTTLSTLTTITNWGNIVDNAAFTDGTTRLSPSGYIFDEVAGTGLTENDAAAARVDSKRAQVLVMEDETTRGQRATVTTRKSMLQEGPTASDAALAAAPVTVGGRASTAVPSAMSADGDVVDQWLTRNGATVVDGGVAHDGADSGSPTKIGGRAVNAEITPVSANNDRTDAVFDLTGKQIVLPYSNPENFVSGAITSAMTGTTSTSLIAAPAAGLRNYITQITVSNSHATVGTDVIIQDGSGGTTLYTIPAAAVYGGSVLTFPVPLRQPTTATAIYCANVTTGASTKVSASGYKGA